MKDLFKTFCWTVGIVLLIALLVGTIYVVGLISELCPTPSPTVKIILGCCSLFLFIFIMVHIMRHPGRSFLDDWYATSDLHDTKVHKAEFKECNSCASKPGSPLLCDACLHNRETIHRLLSELNG